MLGRITLLLALLPAIALAAAAPSSMSDGGRPVIPPPPRAAPPPPAPTATATPVLLSQPAEVPPDPAECRTTCAQTYYFCRAGDRPEDCGSPWSQCVVACNTAELDPTLSPAP